MSEPFFKLGGYTSWITQLRAFLEQNALQTSPFGQFVNSIPLSDQTQFRQIHVQLMSWFSRGEDQFPLLDKQKVAEWMFTQCQLRDFEREIVNKFFPATLLESAMELGIFWNRHFRIMPDAVFDPNVPGNSPLDYANLGYVLWQSGKTRFCRTPTVVNQKGEGHGIADAVQAFISSCKQAGKSIVYVNNMFSHFPNPQFIELTYTQILHEQDRRVDSPFIAFTVDRNSLAYHCSNHFSSSLDPRLGNATYHKQQWTDHLFGADPHFICSSKRDVAVVKRKFEHLLNRIHVHFFGNREQLTDVERRVMNELSLLFLIESEIEDIQPDFFYSACRWTSDRGPSFYTGLYILSQYKRGMPINYWDVVAMLSGPALLYLNRLPHHVRADTLIGVAYLLSMHPNFFANPSE